MIPWYLLLAFSPSNDHLSPGYSSLCISITHADLISTGNFYKGISSLILSHVANEPDLFTPTNIQSDTDFNAFIDAQFPPYAKAGGVNSAIEAHYPPINSGATHNYSTEFDRTKALVGDSSLYVNF